MTQASNTLAMNVHKQAAIVGYLIKDSKFYHACQGKVEKNWFTNYVHGELYAMLGSFVSKYGRGPKSIEELKSADEYKYSNTDKKKVFNNELLNCVYRTDEYGLDVLKLEMTDWLKCQIMMHGMQQAADSFNHKQFDVAVSKLNQVVKEYQSADFDAGPELKFSGFESYLEEQELELKNAMTLGSKKIDKAIAPMCESGCLLPGDTTLVLAPSNVGKSTFVVTVAKANLKAGKRILLIAQEGNAMQFRNLILTAVTGIARNDIYKAVKNQETKEKMRLVAEVLDKRMTYAYLSKAGGTVQDTGDYIRHKQEELKAKEGRYYDMVIHDYPGLLTMKDKNVKYEYRNMVDSVYRYMVALGKEFGTHMLLPIQSNRDGSKKSKEGEGVLDVESVAESWGPIQAADNVLTLSKTRDDEQAGYLNIYLAKSRMNKKGLLFRCKSKLDFGMTHKDEWGISVSSGAKEIAYQQIQEFVDSPASKKETGNE